MWKVTILVTLLTGTLANEERTIEEIVVERIEFPMGDKSPLMRNVDLRVKKFNRTTVVLDGSIEFLQPITNEMKVK
jgi:ferric iron reductase protein FhuF